MPARLHFKYLLIPGLFIVALPVLPQSGGEGHILDLRVFFPVSTTTTDGILLCLGMTSGRHKEGHKKRQEHKDPLVEVYHRVWPHKAAILSFMSLSWASRAQSGSAVARLPVMNALGFGERVWQKPKNQKLILHRRISISKDMRS